MSTDPLQNLHLLQSPAIGSHQSFYDFQKTTSLKYKNAVKEPLYGRHVTIQIHYPLVSGINYHLIISIIIITIINMVTITVASHTCCVADTIGRIKVMLGYLGYFKSFIAFFLTQKKRHSWSRPVLKLRGKETLFFREFRMRLLPGDANL